MPSIKILESVIKPEFMEKIKSVKKNIKANNLDDYKQNLSDTLQEKFWIQPDLDDRRLSESPKLI